MAADHVPGARVEGLEVKVEGVDEIADAQGEDGAGDCMGSREVRSYRAEKEELKRARSWWIGWLEGEEKVETNNDHIYEEEASLVAIDDSLAKSWVAHTDAAECWGGATMAQAASRGAP